MYTVYIALLYSPIIIPFDPDPIYFCSRDMIETLKKCLDFDRILFFK